MKLLIANGHLIDPTENKVEIIMKETLIATFLLIFIAVNCSSNSAENKAKSILNDVMQLQNEQDDITKAMLAKPNIFSDENLKSFPDNRQLLASTAQEQIKSVNQLIQLDEEQISKLKEIENLPLDKNYLEYSRITRQLFESRLESKKLSLQKFGLILDNNLSDKKQIEEDVSKLEQKESDINQTITQIENQKQNFRKTRGK